MKLELSMLAGAESKQFLVDLTKQIDRLEKLANEYGVPTAATKPDETEERDADEDFEPKKSKVKTMPEPDLPGDGDDDDGEPDFKAPTVKKEKVKKVTVDDCNDAAKTRAMIKGGKLGRTEVLSLMKKHFKTESVSELKPEQYEKFIQVMQES